MTSYRNIIEGPRWVGISTFVKDAAFAMGLKLHLDIDKGWLRETIRFEVEGHADDIARFMNALQTALAEYQKRISK